MKNTLVFTFLLLIGFGCANNDEFEYPKELIGKWYLYDVVVNPGSGIPYVEKVDEFDPETWIKFKRNGDVVFLPPGSVKTITSEWKYTLIENENQFASFLIEFEIYNKPTKWNGFFWPNSDTLVFDYPFSRRFVKR